MQAELSPLFDLIVKVGAGLIVPATAGLIKLSGRVTLLEKQWEEKRQVISNIHEGHAEHAERLSVIETVLADLKELVPALRSIANVTNKMEVLIEHTVHRIDVMENRWLDRNNKNA